jgi:hypothetical protein
VGGQDAEVDMGALGGKVSLAALEHCVAEDVELLVFGRGGPVVWFCCDVGGGFGGVWFAQSMLVGIPFQFNNNT